MQKTIAVSAAFAVLALVACGGGGGTTPATHATATPGATATPTNTPAVAGLPASATAGGNTVYASTTAGATDGFTLYELSDDTTTSLACTVASGCTGVWPPYTATAADQTATLPTGFAVFARSDDSGALQWAFNGHPLYTYAGDSTAGQVNGEGITSFGGTWSFSQPAATSPAPSTSPSSPYISR